MAGSLLRTVGLPGLITDSPAAYEALALRLTREPALLAALRERLAANRLSTPLFDSERFTRHLEAAYRQMWQHHCAGQAPAAFAVASADTHFDQGLLLHQRGRLAEAEAAYRRSLELGPPRPEALNNLGNLLLDSGRLDQAEAAYRRALGLCPQFAEAHINLGNLLRRRDRPQEAEAALRQALQLRPDHAEAHNNLGVLLQERGRLEEAEAACRRTLSLRPRHAQALYNLGNVLQARGRPHQAEAAYREALAIEPCYARALHNLGNLLQEQGRPEQALAAYRQAVACRPDYPEAIGQLHYQCRYACDWGDLAEREAQVRALVRAGAGDIPPFTFLALRAPLAEQAACARHWAKRRATVAAGAVFSHTPGRRHGRIRLGYLSADFHEHATAYLMAELFERHDRGNFEVIGYSYGPDDASPMRARLQRVFDRFVDLRGLPPAAAAARLHADAVDILVDLKGYTQGALPTILAHRPAPVQVNYLGYPGTLGAPFIDYLIADAVVAPFAHQGFYDEALVHLPGCYQPNDTQRAIAEHTPTRAQCGLPDSGLVLCCFNSGYKLTPEFFAIWMRLLTQTPGSVLWLLEANALVRDNLRREAATRGVDPARLVFAPRLPLPEHLARQRLADLFLDTLPVNAHTTASDALWVGLPVLTCVGESFIGRVGGSLLRAVGLAELVTDTPAAYEALALRLAREPALLAELRARLAAGRSSAPLFDSGRYTRHLEIAYRRMWERWCAGLGPVAFAVEDGADG